MFTEKLSLDAISSNQLTLVVLSAALLIGGAASFAAYNIDIDSQQHDFGVQVWVQPAEGENLTFGFDTGEGMSYGEVMIGTNLTRKLNVTNVNEPTYITTEATGNMSEGLEYDRKHFIEDDKKIEYKFVTESVNQTGYFNGTINFELNKAGNKWEERWLRALYSLPY